MVKNDYLPKQNLSKKPGIVLQIFPVSGLNENRWVLLSAGAFDLCRNPLSLASGKLPCAFVRRGKGNDVLVVV